MKERIHGKPRCIVLPLQDEAGPGSGLTLNFLLGKVIAAHIAFKECWFGWRTGKIFPQPEALKHYCHGRARELNLKRIGKTQDVRCWVLGRVSSDRVQLCFVDTQTDTPQPAQECSFTLEDHLVDFRRCFLNLLGRCGFPLARERWRLVMWHENISPDGLRLLGRALETFYLHSAYAAQAAIDLSPFEAAFKAAPASFMANNLLGWALHRRQNTSTRCIASRDLLVRP